MQSDEIFLQIAMLSKMFLRQSSRGRSLPILAVLSAAAVLGLPTLSHANASRDVLHVSAQADTSDVMHLAQTTSTDTIVDVAAESGSFDTLVEAVQAAGLADTLASEGPFTVFAPTDEAFANLPDGALDALLMPENRDLLTDILTYHVVPDAVMSEELQTGTVPSLNGDLAVSVDPTGVAVNDANVIQPDVEASNGVIHVVDQVLIPPSAQSELEALLQDSTPATTTPDATSTQTTTETTEPIRGLW